MAAPLSREGAAHAAHEELNKHVYQQARPSVEQQVLSAVWRWIDHAYHRLVDATPGGAIGLLVIIAVIAIIAVVITRRGVSGRRRTADTGFDLPADVTADQLRSEADAFAARGEWAEAVRSRLRAVVRTLEERGILDPRPGRTATEVAAEAGRVRPDLSAQLRRAAGAFGEIWYGRRTATAADDAVLRELDSALRSRHRPEALVAAGSAGFDQAPR